MRTETRTLYKFDELPTEAAKQQARDWWIGCGDPAWNDESRESIQTFCTHFGVKLKDWEIGAYYPLSYSTDAEPHHFRGKRLHDFKRDYMPTGYCLDCDLWMTFYDQFKATGDAKAAFDDALYAGFKAWQQDLEHQMSDEYIDEHLCINEYEFDEEGRIV
jgi:hypothetical protein